MPKDRTPPEIAAIRWRREKRRLLTAAVLWFIWFGIFTAGIATGSVALQALAWVALSAQMTVLYGLHERALRKIAGRPAPDYQVIHKLQKQLPKEKGET